mgnify:CR=1 FL=1
MGTLMSKYPYNMLYSYCLNLPHKIWHTCAVWIGCIPLSQEALYCWSVLRPVASVAWQRTLCIMRDSPCSDVCVIGRAVRADPAPMLVLTQCCTADVLNKQWGLMKLVAGAYGELINLELFEACCTNTDIYTFQILTQHCMNFTPFFVFHIF